MCLKNGNMFSLLTSCYSNRRRSTTARNVTLIILGLDNAGKTTTVKDLKGESKNEVTPTLGFSTVSLKFGRLSITLFDVGGGPTIRDIWTEYFADVHAFIYVVDSTDEDRLTEVASTLKGVMMEPLLQGKPCLILANKQDREGALGESTIAHILDLENIANESGCNCRLELCSALTPACGRFASQAASKKSSPIQEGFRWLVERVLDEWESLDERVVRDRELAEEKARVEHEARKERIRKMKEQRELEEKQRSKEEEKRQVVGNGTDSATVDAFTDVTGERMKHFAEVMQQVGNDLNNSLSESLKSTRGSQRSSKKEDSFVQDTENTTSTTTTDNFASTGGQGQERENDDLQQRTHDSVDADSPDNAGNLFTVDHRNPEHNKSNRKENLRQLPPLKEELSSKGERKKKKKVKKNQLAPYNPEESRSSISKEEQWIIEPHLKSTTNPDDNLFSEKHKVGVTLEGGADGPNVNYSSLEKLKGNKDIGKTVIGSFTTTESDFYDSDFVSDTNFVEHRL